jgi:hypothetical protein
VLRKMQVFWYVMLGSITVQRPTLIKPWWCRWYSPVKLSYTMTPLTQHHIHKTWILTYQFTIHQYWYHQLYMTTYCQKVNHTRKKKPETKLKS